MDLPRDLTDDELQVVRDALASRPSCLRLAGTLRASAMANGSEGLRMLSLAFVYDLVEAGKEARRSSAEGPYARMWADETGSYPPHPSEVIAEVRSVWRAARDSIDDPIVSSRISDLLYVAEGQSAHQDGRVAAHGLLELACLREWDPMDRAACMSRAMEILTELNDEHALKVASDEAVALVDELLGQEYPGPPFTVVRALVRLKPRRRPDELDALLDRVVDRFGDHHAQEGALSLAAAATSDEARRKSLRLRQLQVRVAHAESAEGVAKVASLQRAIDLARSFGFATEAAELLRQLQDLPTEELGLQTFETETEVPVEAVRNEVDRIAGSGATDIFDALRRIGVFGPPGGSHADIEAEVEEQMREFPLQHLFTQHVIGPASSAPTFIAQDDESKLWLARGRQRRLHATYVGEVLLTPMLTRAVEHHGRPSHDKLSEHFSTDLIGEHRGERIARSLELFWDRDFDASAHVLVPRLESVLRDIARASGITIATPARNGRFTGVISLNQVMDRLRSLQPEEEWLDYIEALLCDPLAVNMRNDISHGISGPVSRVGAALLLQVACYLSLLRQRASVDEPRCGPEQVTERH